MPFTVTNEAEAITILGLLIVALGLLIFSEIMNRQLPVLKIITAGLMFYLFTLTKSPILQICFLGLAIYNLFRIIGRD